ncbi:hypothetical protein DFJ73DRAFT_813096 [Zopfochytrium polystomum]|nr:hypothetical protein DFJ73DRAFT_813096 [Zopfochytrium polystomum]
MASRIRRSQPLTRPAIPLILIDPPRNDSSDYLKENPFEMIDQVACPLHEPNRGFCIYLDRLTGIPFYGASRSRLVEITYGIFLGSEPISLVESTGPREYSASRPSLLGSLEINTESLFTDIAPDLSTRVIVQLWVVEQDSHQTEPHFMRPVGWSSLDLFDSSMSIRYGRWKVHLFQPPIDFTTPTLTLQQTRNTHPNAHLFLRLYDPSVSDIQRSVRVDENGCKAFYRGFVAGDVGVQEFAVNVKIMRDRGLMGAGLLPKKGDKQPQEVLRGQTRQSRDSFDERLSISKQSLKVLPEVRTLSFAIRIDSITDVKPFSEGHVTITLESATSSQLEEVWASENAEMGLLYATLGWTQTVQEFIARDKPALESTKATFSFIFADKAIKSPESNDHDLVEVFEGEDIRLREGKHQIQLWSLGDSTRATINFTVYKLSSASPPLKPFESLKGEYVLPHGHWLPPAKQTKPDEPFAKGDKFKLEIDGGRFFPLNCTVSRVVARVLSAGQAMPDGFMQLNSEIDLDSDPFFPKFSGAQFYEMQNDATLTALFKLYTVDRYSRHHSLIGMSLLNIFKDSDGAQPRYPHASPIYLNIGYHQLPVYLPPANSKFEHGLSVTSLIERVPCCSILARLSSGYRDLPKASYSDGVFETSLCQPLKAELPLYKALERYEHSPSTIRDSIKLIAELPDVEDSLMQAWIAKRLEKREKISVPALDLSHIAPVHPLWGIRLSVDSAESLRTKAYSVAVVSMVPPGTWYETDAKKIDRDVSVRIFSKVSFDSRVKSPVWEDDFQWFQNISTLPQAVFIVDVRCLGYSEQDKQPKIQSQGWTAIEAFQHENFVTHGAFKLPLYDGNPAKEFLELVGKGVSLSDAMAICMKSKVVRLAKKHASVRIRICDGRRNSELPKKRVEGRSTMLDFEDLLFSKLIPRGSNPEEYRSKCITTILQLL